MLEEEELLPLRDKMDPAAFTERMEALAFNREMRDLREQELAKEGAQMLEEIFFSAPSNPS